MQSPPRRSFSIIAPELPKVAANLAAVRPADPPPMMSRSYDGFVLDLGVGVYRTLLRNKKRNFIQANPDIVAHFMARLYF